MKHYNFIQGLLIGVLVWGAVSVGLRYVHYALQVDVPHLIMAPGKAMKPLYYAKSDLSPRDSEFRQFYNIVETKGWSWDAIKDLISFLANLVTLVAPIVSGGVSIWFWRKQRKIMAAT